VGKVEAQQKGGIKAGAIAYRGNHARLFKAWMLFSGKVSQSLTDDMSDGSPLNSLN